MKSEVNGRVTIGHQLRICVEDAAYFRDLKGMVLTIPGASHDQIEEIRNTFEHLLDSTIDFSIVVKNHALDFNIGRDDLEHVAVIAQRTLLEGHDEDSIDRFESELETAEARAHMIRIRLEHLEDEVRRGREMLKILRGGDE